MNYDDRNPRYVYWLRTISETPETFEAKWIEGDTYRIHDDGMNLPWTIVFTQWVRKRWDEYARGCGFTIRDGEGGDACVLGRTAKGFDAWLDALTRTHDPSEASA